MPKLYPDFENDAYVHILAHLSEIAIGTLTFIVADVTNPPAHLFATNLMLYDTMLKSSGGIVAFRFLQYAGVPALHWLRAGRENDGDTCEVLHALAFHKLMRLDLRARHLH